MRGAALAAFGVEIGLVQVEAQQGEECAVAFGEVGARGRRSAWRSAWARRAVTVSGGDLILVIRGPA